MTEKIHIGELIRKEIHKEGRSASWLAGKLDCGQAYIYKLLKKSSLNTDLLLRISIILKYDFFDYYSKHLHHIKYCPTVLFSTCMNEKIHVGEQIRKKFKEENKTIKWFSGKLHYEQDNIFKIFKKSDLVN